jgi:hypothetical protein
LFRRAAAVTLGSLAARGVYEVLDELDGPTRAEAAPVIRRFQEQYLIDQIEVIVDNGVTVGIPPLHNDVFTAKLKSSINWTTAALKSAKTRVENAIAKVEAPYPSTAAGLTIVVGWGLPYFRTFAAPLWKTYLPALPNTNPTQYAVLDAIRFPSDPTGVVLEDNHVMFKFRSDSSSIVSGAERALFDDQNSGAYIGDLFDLTSKRIGFLGRGFGTRSIGKMNRRTRSPTRTMASTPGCVPHTARTTSSRRGGTVRSPWSSCSPDRGAESEVRRPFWRLGHPPDAVAEREQAGLRQRLGRLEPGRHAAVAAGRLAIGAVEAAREVVRVGEAAVLRHRGDAEVAAGEQRGGAGEAQQLERCHRPGPVVATEQPAQVAGRDARSSRQLPQRQRPRGRGRRPRPPHMLEQGVEVRGRRQVVVPVRERS